MFANKLDLETKQEFNCMMNTVQENKLEPLDFLGSSNLRMQ